MSAPNGIRRWRQSPYKIEGAAMKLFVFGLGYTAQALIAVYRDRFSGLTGTVRSCDKAKRLEAQGIRVHALEDLDREALADDLARAQAILISASPSEDGDPFLSSFGDLAARISETASIGYLSSASVYGDHGGAWVDEATPPVLPLEPRALWRLEAEEAWLRFGEQAGRTVQVFRLAGIYGPSRNVFPKLARGTAQRIVLPGQVFNRIHVADAVMTIMIALIHPFAGRVYNVSDDEPAPLQDVITYAARLAGIEPPPEISLEQANLTPTAMSFYSQNKRLSNCLLREKLGIKLQYPTYREGLKALYDQGEWPQAA